MTIRYLSLFSGMEAAHLAFRSLGWVCAAVAEIDAAPCTVLEHQLPGVPNLGSVVDITEERIAALGRIDVVIGGSPCQDLSIAGKRAGLVGERSSLFHQQVRIFDAARSLCGARWLVWENVPGAFSSHKGRDFAVVVGTLAGLELAVPKDGWGTEGAAAGPRGLVEWSVLDAQWFGLAQRRKRVFAVLDTGNWADRPPVLLERESLRGDSPPRREAGQNVAGTLTPSALGGSSPTGGDGREGMLIAAADVAPTLCANGNKGGGDRPPGTTVDSAETLICVSSGQANAEIAEDLAPTLTLLHEVPYIAHALRADGFDASEDGTGRGPPLVPVAFDARQSDVIQYGDKSGPLDTDRMSIGVLAYRWAASSQESMSPGDVAPPMRANRNGEPAVGVRRLTPRECERLQGVPDDWTLVPRKGKPMKDGPRYKMLGNSFAVPVIRWIGQQIERAQAEALEAAA